MNTETVLLIDDNFDFADGMLQALEIEDYQVQLALNGSDGIAAATSRNFTYALSDVGLPDINGFEVLSRIKQISPGTICILLTGYSEEHLLKLGIRPGLFRILTKPVVIESLIELFVTEKPLPQKFTNPRESSKCLWHFEYSTLKSADLK